MAPFDKHLFICCNRREPGHPRGCCDPSGSEALQKAFKKALAERGINRRPRQQVRLPRPMREGPDVVVYPDDVWYGRVTEADVTEISRSTSSAAGRWRVC